MLSLVHVGHNYWHPIIATSFSQHNSSEFSPIMPEEFGETPDKRSETIFFIQNLSRSFRFTAPCWCFFSSVHLTHFLQGSGQGTEMAIAEAWFCAQWPILCCFEVVFGLLYGWKIQTWPIIRFLTESVTYWFLSVGIDRIHDAMCLNQCPGPPAEI